jgi:hypothetical protein
MTATSPLRCVICGRLKPTRERWSTFVDAMRGHTRAIMAAASARPVTPGRALAALERELGSPEAAARHLARVAANVGKPIGVNVPTAEGSRTCFMAPKGWTQERLAGWVAGHHEVLERQFGPAALIDMEEVIVNEREIRNDTLCAGSLPGTPHAIDPQQAHTVVAQPGKARALVCGADCLARYLRDTSDGAKQNGALPGEGGLTT